MVVIRIRGLVVKQGFLLNYTKGDAIGTKANARYRESGCLLEVVVKRGSTVYAFINHSSLVIEKHKHFKRVLSFS